MTEIGQLMKDAFEAYKEGLSNIKNKKYDLANLNYSRAEHLLKRIINLPDYDESKRRTIEQCLFKVEEEHDIIREKLIKREGATAGNTFSNLGAVPKYHKPAGGLSDDVASAGLKSQSRPPNAISPKSKVPTKTNKHHTNFQSKATSSWKESKLAKKKKYEPRNPSDAHLADMIESEIRLKEIDDKVTLRDVAGMPDVKQRLREAIEWPTLFPELCTELRSPITGLLLFGPPGTGKTKIAKALANLGGLEFFNVQQSVIIAKEVGDSERMIRILFDMARFYAPSILFFDEIDSIGGTRSMSNEAEASRRLKAELLIQMDGVSADRTKRVLIIGATNFPWSVDEALRRRLEKRILVPLPDYEARLEILKALSKDTVLSKKVRLEDIAAKLEGYSGSDVVNLYTSAAQGFLAKLTHINAKIKTIKDVDRNVEKLLPQNFDIAFENIRKTVALGLQKKYDDWAKEYGSM